MAEIDFDLVRKTALAVKALEKVATAKDYPNFLNPAKELSENVVKLVQMATANNLLDYAADLREKVKNTMASAKVVLRDKTDDALNQFIALLKDVAKVVVELMMELKKRGTGAVRRYKQTLKGKRSDLFFKLPYLRYLPLIQHMRIIMHTLKLSTLGHNQKDL